MFNLNPEITDADAIKYLKKCIASTHDTKKISDILNALSNENTAAIITKAAKQEMIFLEIDKEIDNVVKDLASAKKALEFVDEEISSLQAVDQLSIKQGTVNYMYAKASICAAAVKQKDIIEDVFAYFDSGFDLDIATTIIALGAPDIIGLGDETVKRASSYIEDICEEAEGITRLNCLVALSVLNPKKSGMYALSCLACDDPRIYKSAACILDLAMGVKRKINLFDDFDQEETEEGSL